MLKFLAVMNSTIRCFCYACNMAVFASADALRRLERLRSPHFDILRLRSVQEAQ